MRQKMKLLMGILLSFAMVLGLMPGTKLTAYATSPYSSLVLNQNDTDEEVVEKKVQFGGYEWYVLEDNSTSNGTAGTLTLLAAECFGASKYNSSSSAGNLYSNSLIKGAVDALTNEGGALYAVAGSIDTVSSLQTYEYGSDSVVYDTATNVKCYLLDVATAHTLPLEALRNRLPDGASYNCWYLRSPGYSTNGYVLVTAVHASYAQVLDTENNGNIGSTMTNTLGIRPALKLKLSSVVYSPVSQMFAAGKETTPNATFTATGPNSGTLSGMTADMKYRIGNGSWVEVTNSNDVNLTGLSACTIQIVKEGDGIINADSDPQNIVVTKAATPTAPRAYDCTTVNNNDGRLTGISASMEYKKSDAATWTSGTGNTLTGLVPGTYYVRTKANGTALASDNQQLTIKRIVTASVTFKVRNGSWNDGETADRRVTLTGLEGSGLRLSANQIPAAGQRPNENYKVGSWDVEPNTTTALSGTVTYTYTYELKPRAYLTVEPT
ncbi:MAG: hypothetical protein IKO00_12790, partial [Oscillospiraceae bacterium]|nr:hypothetical protein [Oscillospiraceae bacterium]